MHYDSFSRRERGRQGERQGHRSLKMINVHGTRRPIKSHTQPPPPSFSSSAKSKWPLLRFRPHLQAKMSLSIWFACHITGPGEMQRGEVGGRCVCVCVCVYIYIYVWYRGESLYIVIKSEVLNRLNS